MEFTEIHFQSADGLLNLHGRDQGPRDGLLNVLCMGGLTRNLLDFADLAEHLSDYRVISVDQRGRGRSDWDPEHANYNLLVQVGDMFALLDQLQLDRVALVGTSNGGLMAMLMAAMQPHRVAGIVLNDVGPFLPASALRRIRDSLADRPAVHSWTDAAEQAKQVNEFALPTYGPADWEKFARRTYMNDESGGLIAAYDPGILKPLIDADLSQEQPDMWSVWDAIQSTPVLIVRGAISDLLPENVLREMLARHPRAESVVVPDRGHCPMLDEPEAVSAVDDFLRTLER